MALSTNPRDYSGDFIIWRGAINKLNQINTQDAYRILNADFTDHWILYKKWPSIFWTKQHEMDYWRRELLMIPGHTMAKLNIKKLNSERNEWVRELERINTNYKPSPFGYIKLPEDIFELPE